MGNKVLRQRLRGPALAAYYPRRVVTFEDLQREFAPDLLAMNEWDEDRLERLAGCVIAFGGGIALVIVLSMDADHFTQSTCPWQGIGKEKSRR